MQINDRAQEDSNENAENFESRMQILNGNYVRFSNKVDNLFKNELANSNAANNNNKNRFYEIINKDKQLSVQQEDKMFMWLDNKDIMCSCPKIKLKRKYLIMTKKSNLLKYLPRSEGIKTPQDESIHLNYDLDLDDSLEAIYGGNNRTTTKLVTISTLDISKPRVAGLLIDRETFIVEWRPEFARRLRRFSKHFQNGKCI